MEVESYTNDGTGFNLSLQNYCIAGGLSKAVINHLKLVSC